jgi:hypothetical protein
VRLDGCSNAGHKPAAHLHGADDADHGECFIATNIPYCAEASLVPGHMMSHHMKQRSLNYGVVHSVAIVQTPLFPARVAPSWAAQRVAYCYCY